MIGFDFSGLTLRLTGLPSRHETRLRTEWATFVSDAISDPWLDIHAVVVDGGGVRSGSDAKRMTLTVDGSISRWTMTGGAARVPLEGPIELHLEDASDNEVTFVIINLLHAAIASRLASIGGAFLHAAGAVVDGRAFVLVGAANAGKTTWVGLANDAGATVLSDDIVIVVRSGEGFEVVGTPLRAKDFGGGVRGRWPLASILLPRHGATAVVEPASQLFARAALTANLPYVADDRGRGGELDAIVSAIVAAVPARTLVFSRDDGGIDQLREMPG